MMSATARNNRFPFTASQWQELEHQALIFKYMVSGIPIPPDLLFTIRRSLESSSFSSKLILHQPQHIGWNCFQMGFGRKIDPEPGRCRRTDGKKWRCSKEAYADSKYCERHMHRGRNRSRKPVETSTNTSTRDDISLQTAIPISSIARNNQPPNPSSPYNIQTNSTSHQSITPFNSSPLHNPLLYPPHLSSSRPSAIPLESSPYSQTDSDYRIGRSSSYGHGLKEEVGEHAFFSGSSGTMRSMSVSSVGDSSWHMEPLSWGGSALKQRTNVSGLQSGYSYLQLSSKEKQEHQYYGMDDDDLPLKMGRDDDVPEKVMHHFFDEWPKNKDSWLDETHEKLSNHGHVTTTQLSISMPKSSHHDFFMTHNEK